MTVGTKVTVVTVVTGVTVVTAVRVVRIVIVVIVVTVVQEDSVWISGVWIKKIGLAKSPNLGLQGIYS